MCKWVKFRSLIWHTNHSRGILLHFRCTKPWIKYVTVVWSNIVIDPHSVRNFFEQHWDDQWPHHSLLAFLFFTVKYFCLCRIIFQFFVLKNTAVNCSTPAVCPFVSRQFCFLVHHRLSWLSASCNVPLDMSIQSQTLPPPLWFSPISSSSHLSFSICFSSYNISVCPFLPAPSLLCPSHLV